MASSSPNRGENEKIFETTSQYRIDTVIGV